MTLSDVLSAGAAVFIDPVLFGAMLAGMVMGMVFGAVPGLSGKMGLLLVLPLLFGMEPAVGIVLLLSMHAVIHTGGSIPSILVGVPGGAPEAATVIDGFAMAKKGQAAQALGASMAASGIGGATGAVCYFLFLPVFAALGSVFGAPEYLLLALLGLCAVATLSEGSAVKGFTMGGLGLLAGSVGMDYATGTPRFVFGRLELWDGLDLLILVSGFFAVPELLDMARKKKMLPTGEDAAAGCTYRAMFHGMAETWTHRWLTLRTTIIGLLIGVMPGLGAEVASWLAYGHAVQTAKRPERFGQGAVEGVIAPETANNSKEGGALLPTVVFGIPGSSTMALIIAGLAILGVPVGPSMMAKHGDAVILIGWTVLWSNLLAVLAFVAILPIVGKIVYLRIDYLAPIVLAVVVAGTLIEQTGWLPMLLLFLVSAFGCYLVSANWPRAPFLLGFIMGRLAEVNLVKTTALYGWEAFARWPTLLLAAGLVFVVARGLRSPRRLEFNALSSSDVVVACALLIGLMAAIVHALSFPFEAQLFPVVACAIAIASLAFMLFAHIRAIGRDRPQAPSLPWRLLAGFAALLALVPIAGILAAAFIYAVLYGLQELKIAWWRAVVLGAGVAATIWLVYGVWLRMPLTAGLL